MRWCQLLCCCLLAACGVQDAPQEQGSSATDQEQHDQVQGAPLGAPQAGQESSADTDDVSRDIIVKNAGTDDEMMVSPPQDIRNPIDDLEALHKGQRVGDFADIDSLQVDGYEKVFFSQLSAYVYFPETEDLDHPGADMTLFMQLHNKTEAAKGDKQIPEEIRALDGQAVAVPGFMLPASGLKDGKTNDFLLVRVLPSCFFCRIPNVTEWISCKTVNKKRLPFHNNKPVLIKGTFDVGARYVDGDYLESIYRIEVESVELLD